jgi:thymidylate synthase (FAD)
MSKKVLMPDGVGFVELLEVFGDDLTVVNAARVSFDKQSESLSDADKKLIRYLATHDHVSPFFHPQVRMRIKMPIFCSREWFRHTIGLARNEVSRRYVDSPPECWVPAPTELRERDPRVKQGSKDTAVAEAEEAWQILSVQTAAALDTYRLLLNKGVAPEIARSVLPQSMYTEFIETGSLAAYARICHLRLGADAQKEIRDYAGAVNDVLRDAFPVSWAALRHD